MERGKVARRWAGTLKSSRRLARGKSTPTSTDQDLGTRQRIRYVRSLDELPEDERFVVRAIAEVHRRPGPAALPERMLQVTLYSERQAEKVLRLRDRTLKDIEALVARAKGTKFLVARDPKTGKFITRLTQKRLEDLMKHGYEVFEVWSREPSDSAACELLDRALDRPKEQPQELNLNHGATEELLAALDRGRERARQRLGVMQR